MKNFVSLSLCLLLAFGSFASIKCFAALEDIPIQGGSYAHVMKEKKEYKKQHPEDQTIYECHHLISKEALNRWGEKIKRRGLANKNNEFLVNDLNQNWAPAIVMEKADHERTLSYFNLKTRNNKKNNQAFDYIRIQANRIIYFGDIIGVLNDEVEYIHKTFGNKYDKALKQVIEYINFLKFRYCDCKSESEPEYATNKFLIMNNPYMKNVKFFYKFL